MGAPNEGGKTQPSIPNKTLENGRPKWAATSGGEAELSTEQLVAAVLLFWIPNV